MKIQNGVVQISSNDFTNSKVMDAFDAFMTYEMLSPSQFDSMLQCPDGTKYEYPKCDSAVVKNPNFIKFAEYFIKNNKAPSEYEYKSLTALQIPATLPKSINWLKIGLAVGIPLIAITTVVYFVKRKRGK